MTSFPIFLSLFVFLNTIFLPNCVSWITFGLLEYVVSREMAADYSSLVQRCQDLKASLVIVNTKEIQTFLIEEMRILRGDPYSFYIGLEVRGIFSKDHFWEDGTVAGNSYSNWDIEQPNPNRGVRVTMGSPYVYFKDFRWVVVSGAELSRVVCQRPLAWFPYQSFEYAIPSSVAYSFDEVRNFCAMFNATPVIIKSEGVRNFVSKLVKDIPGTPYAFYIGLTREKTADFVWVDGTSLDSGMTFWKRFEPNSNTAKCVTAGSLWKYDKDILWADARNRNLHSRIVCQRPISVNSKSGSINDRRIEYFQSWVSFGLLEYYVSQRIASDYYGLGKECAKSKGTLVIVKTEELYNFIREEMGLIRSVPYGFYLGVYQAYDHKVPKLVWFDRTIVQSNFWKAEKPNLKNGLYAFMGFYASYYRDLPWRVVSGRLPTRTVCQRPLIWTSFGTFEYALPSKIADTYEECERFCALFNATLIMIKSADVRKFVNYLAKDIKGYPYSFFIGLVRVGTTNNEFRWVDGSNINTGETFWNAGEPSKSKAGHVRMGNRSPFNESFPWYAETNRRKSRIFCQRPHNGPPVTFEYTTEATTVAETTTVMEEPTTMMEEPTTELDFDYVEIIETTTENTTATIQITTTTNEVMEILEIQVQADASTGEEGSGIYTIIIPVIIFVALIFAILVAAFCLRRKKKKNEEFFGDQEDIAEDDEEELPEWETESEPSSRRSHQEELFGDEEDIAKDDEEVLPEDDEEVLPEDDEEVLPEDDEEVLPELETESEPSSRRSRLLSQVLRSGLIFHQAASTLSTFRKKYHRVMSISHDAPLEPEYLEDEQNNVIPTSVSVAENRVVKFESENRLERESLSKIKEELENDTEEPVEKNEEKTEDSDEKEEKGNET